MFFVLDAEQLLPLIHSFDIMTSILPLILIALFQIFSNCEEHFSWRPKTEYSITDKLVFLGLCTANQSTIQCQGHWMEVLLAIERFQIINPERKIVIIRCFRWTSTRPTTNEYFHFWFVKRVNQNQSRIATQTTMQAFCYKSFLIKARSVLSNDTLESCSFTKNIWQSPGISLLRSAKSYFTHNSMYYYHSSPC